DFDVECGLIAGVAVRIAQTRERLVQGVPRRPEPIQIEVCRADVALRDFRERFLHAGERSREAVAVLVLNGFQFADDVVGALLELRVAGRGVHQTDRREVMAGDVSGQLAAVSVPARVARRLRLQSRADAVEGEHAIRFEREQIRGVEILRVLQRPAGQPDSRQRQRPRRVGHRACNLFDEATGDEPRRAAENELQEFVTRELHDAIFFHCRAYCSTLSFVTTSTPESMIGAGGRLPSTMFFNSLTDSSPQPKYFWPSSTWTFPSRSRSSAGSIVSNETTFVFDGSTAASALRVKTG